MLKVSPNQRFLIHRDGQPFFYLGDTAWELFHRPTFSDAQHYLRDRAAKGFTVIQAVVLAEHEGLTAPNPEGQLPLENLDPGKPNEKYFAQVDRIVDYAAELGLYIGMLPTWGDKWNLKWGKGPEIFTPENARPFGEFIGRRYRDKPIIWILGGDRPIEKPEHRTILDAMAAGVRDGDGGAHLMTFHPCGGKSSSDFVADAPWLDFHMCQSGHNRNADNHAKIAHDYALPGPKPCLDGEPGYEDHPAGFKVENGFLDDYDVRKAIYWALFAGACGHTYGCHPIWGFWQTPIEPRNYQRRDWREALLLPGAGQIRYARALLESRPYLTRIPDQSLIAGDPGAGHEHLQATRDASGSYAFIYFPTRRAVGINTSVLSGTKLSVHWYDPRTGLAHDAGQVDRGGVQSFTPPAVLPDWVLVLDDAQQRFGRPGAAAVTIG